MPLLHRLFALLKWTLLRAQSHVGVTLESLLLLILPQHHALIGGERHSAVHQLIKFVASAVLAGVHLPKEASDRALLRVQVLCNELLRIFDWV